MGTSLEPEYWESPDFRLMLTPEVATLYSQYEGDLWSEILDAANMAVSFGYRESLFNLVAMCYTQNDSAAIQVLYDTYPLEIVLNRGCLSISPQTEGDMYAGSINQEGSH